MDYKEILKKMLKLNTDFCNLLEKIINFEVMPKQILVKLIDKIEIFKDKSIKIHYKFPRPQTFMDWENFKLIQVNKISFPSGPPY